MSLPLPVKTTSPSKSSYGQSSLKQASSLLQGGFSRLTFSLVLIQLRVKATSESVSATRRYMTVYETQYSQLMLFTQFDDMREALKIFGRVVRKFFGET
jgi:hypothetical protein